MAWFKRWSKRMAWLVGGLLALVALLWLGLPPLIKTQAQSRGSAALGRPVTLGEVKIEPFQLALTVSDLTIGSAPAKGAAAVNAAAASAASSAMPLLRIARIRVEADMASIWQRAPVIRALQIDAPQLRLTRMAEGHYDIDDLELRDVQPLKRQVHLAALKLDGANLVVLREANGAINWQRLGAEPAAPSSTVAGAAKASAPASATVPDSATTSAWAFALDDLQLSSAQVQLTDNAVRPRAQWLVDGISVQVQQLRWPNPAAMPVQAAATLRKGVAATDKSVLASDKAATASPAIGTLAIKGQANMQQAALDLQIEGLLLEPLAPYFAQVLTPNVSGKLSTQATLDWSGGADAPRLKLDLTKATLDNLRLSEGTGRSAATLMAWQRLALGAVQVDLLAHKVSLGSIKLARPSLQVARDSAGHWNVQRWLVAAAPAATTAKAAAVQSTATAAHTAASPKADAPWALVLKDLAIDAGQVMVSDAAAAPTKSGASTDSNNAAGASNPPGTSPQALKFDLSNLRLRVNDLAWPAASGQPIKLQLAALLGAPASPGAKPTGAGIDWNGRLGLAPLQASGALTIERLDVHLFEPYFGASIPVHLQQAQTSLKGQLKLLQAPAGLQAELAADVQVADLLLRTRPVPVPGQPAPSADSGDELLSWQSLALDGVAVALAPGIAPKVEVRSISLADFYSRLTITEQGRFNLSDVAASPAVVETSPVGAASASAAGATAVSGPATSASATAPAATTSTATPTSPATSPTLSPVLVIGPTRLVNGRIDFTDRFVRPSYATRLTGLNGQIGAFRSGTRDMASIELRGRAEGTALLNIVGQLNPTANPLALDIRAKATDLELAPLSPYAGKYAGYAIERGKLSMDVSYKIDADGKLEAKNQVILNQLTFGDKVDSPSATNLPVRLAVALLTDRHGVIDINLPVSGSLNDPQFSVTGIVTKIIVNLLTKAFTAPFALLSGGGADDLSVVGFAPGAATMTEPGQQALDKVAKALVDRPALTMTVAGAADPASERDAMQRLALDARLQAERRRELGRSSAPVYTATAAPTTAASTATTAASSATATTAASASGAAANDANAAPAVPPMTAEDRARLLKLVYQQANLPNKPRNPLGQLRDLPAAEMEIMLRAATLVSTDSARELALQRGIAVRDALVAKGLPSSRLFLSAPKLRASAEDDPAWSPRVVLTLAAP